MLFPFFRFHYSFRILSKFHWTPIGEIISCDSSSAISQTDECLKSGIQVLKFYAIEETEILPSDIAGLLSLVALYHFISYLILRWKIKQ